MLDGGGTVLTPGGVNRLPTMSKAEDEEMSEAFARHNSRLIEKQRSLLMLAQRAEAAAAAATATVG